MVVHLSPYLSSPLCRPEARAGDTGCLLAARTLGHPRETTVKCRGPAHGQPSGSRRTRTSWPPQELIAGLLAEHPPDLLVVSVEDGTVLDSLWATYTASGYARYAPRRRRLLARGTVLPTEPVDCEDAARLYRTCRRNGEIVRKLVDCLIAATVIRAGLPILHADADFDVLARHTALAVER
jgi:predicted nucleic acid-binding protein